MTFDGPFRGYVPIADEVLVAARDVVRAIVDGAVAIAMAPAPRKRSVHTIADIDESLLGIVVRSMCHKFDRVYANRLALAPTVEVAARCGVCRSAAIIHVPEHLTISGHTTAIIDALSQLGCYCVQREVAP